MLNQFEAGTLKHLQAANEHGSPAVVHHWLIPREPFEQVRSVAASVVNGRFEQRRCHSGIAVTLVYIEAADHQGGLIVDRFVTGGARSVHPGVSLPGGNGAPSDRHAVAVGQETWLKPIVDLTDEEGPTVVRGGFVELLVGQQVPGAPAVRIRLSPNSTSRSARRSAVTG